MNVTGRCRESRFLPARVPYARNEKPCILVVDHGVRYLYFVEEVGRATL